MYVKNKFFLPKGGHGPMDPPKYASVFIGDQLVSLAWYI